MRKFLSVLTASLLLVATVGLNSCGGSATGPKQVEQTVGAITPASGATVPAEKDNLFMWTMSGAKGYHVWATYADGTYVDLGYGTETHGVLNGVRVDGGVVFFGPITERAGQTFMLEFSVNGFPPNGTPQDGVNQGRGEYHVAPASSASSG